MDCKKCKTRPSRTRGAAEKNAEEGNWVRAPNQGSTSTAFKSAANSGGRSARVTRGETPGKPSTRESTDDDHL